MKKEFLTIAFFLFSIFIFSQEYYIINGKKEILTKFQLEEIILKKNKILKENSSKDDTHIFSVKYKIIETIKKSDSIINKVRYDIKYESTKNEKIYSLENKKIPELNLKNLKSKKVKLNDLKGKVTFINLWFTNCFPCVNEIPLLNILQKKYKKDVNFIAITFDSKEKVEKFLTKKKFNFEHLINAKNYLKKELGNISYPKIIILDKDGIINYISGGIPSEYDYEKRKMKEKTEDDLVYLEKIIEKLIK
tara:strand:+ start:27 stop:773 length:747 start_codon:yes stop_codon:yes gene_type:complete